MPQVEANYCFVDAVTKEDEENFASFIDQVQEEDIILCESVQRGLNSGLGPKKWSYQTRRSLRWRCLCPFKSNWTRIL